VVTKDKQWEIELAKAIKAHKGWPEDLDKVKLTISVPGYLPVERELTSAEGSASDQTLNKPEWKAAPQTVTWTPHPFFTRHYDTIAFRGAERFAVSVGSGKVDLPPGTYSVELTGKIGKVPVENRVLPQKVEVVLGKPAKFQLPPPPQTFGGMATYKFEPTVQVYGYVNETNIMVSRTPQIECATPYIFSFNPDFAGGTVYEESNLMGTSSLQLIDNYVAASINVEKGQKKNFRYLLSGAIKNYGEKLNRFGDLLKADGPLTVANLMEKRLEMADIGKEVFSAINTEFGTDANGKIGPTLVIEGKAIAHYNDSVEAWTRMMGMIKLDGPWPRTIAACVSGGSVQDRDLKELFTGEIFVTHPFEITAIDEKGNLSFKTWLRFWQHKTPGVYFDVLLPYGKLAFSDSGEITMVLAREKGPPDCTATMKVLNLVPMNR
jgi:hypothetical protein